MESLDLEDGNDDQIMSIIGKRPASSSTSTVTTAETTFSSPPNQPQNAVEWSEEEAAEGIIVDASGHLTRMDGGKTTTDIPGDIFRARAAGRYGDKEASDANEAAYREFYRSEEEARMEFDASEATAATTPPQDIDVDAYADDVLSEMDPRPRVRGRMEDVLSWVDVQKERKQEILFGDDDPFPVREEAAPPRSTPPDGVDGGAMPAWFQKEQEARGARVEGPGVDDGGVDEAQYEREREERQRKADEYLKRRGEGISISDVLGRE